MKFPALISDVKYWINSFCCGPFPRRRSADVFRFLNSSQHNKKESERIRGRLTRPSSLLRPSKGH